MNLNQAVSQEKQAVSDKLEAVSGVAGISGVAGKWTAREK